MIFRLLILFTGLLFNVGASFSQSIQNDVFSSAGDAFQTSSYEFSWTLGESVIESHSTVTLVISQGFHQPMFKFSEIEQPEPADFQVILYPNPTSQFVTIKISDQNPEGKYNLFINDLHGRLLLKLTDLQVGENRIDLSKFSSEIMVIKIASNIEGRSRIFKVIRVLN